MLIRLIAPFVAAFSALSSLALLTGAAAAADCPDPNTLGVSRTLAVDTTGGFRVGGIQYHKQKLALAENEVVLTFDDGPSPGTSEKVLAALEAECAKATFFIVGSMAKAHPNTLRAEAAAGHTIGSHTYSHREDLHTQPFEVGAAEIDRGIAEITDVLGVAPAPFFRYPGLGGSDALNQKLFHANIGIFSADVVGDDWLTKDPNVIRQRVLERLALHHGGVILLHDTKKATAEMLPQLLRDLKERGYKLVRLVPMPNDLRMSTIGPDGETVVAAAAPAVPVTRVAGEASGGVIELGPEAGEVRKRKKATATTTTAAPPAGTTAPVPLHKPAATKVKAVVPPKPVPAVGDPIGRLVLGAPRF